METQKPPQSKERSQASHDPETPAALIEFMSDRWLAAPLRAARNLQADRFNDRRATLSRTFPGEYLIVPAGREKVRANDTYFRFRPSSDFAYLAGPGEAGTVLVLEPQDGAHRSVLFVPPHNRGTAAFFTDRAAGEVWTGRRRGVDESQLFFGVDSCRPAGDLHEYLEDLRRRKAPTRDLDGESDADREFAQHLSEMRLLKDDYEIAELRACVETTKRGFEDVIRLLPRARSEREVEAAFSSRSRIEADDVGYLTIAASGDHACTLHWIKNTGEIRKGDLLLLDAGAERESLYTADVTRTLPISGTFTPEQRTIYDLVFAAQRAAFAAVKPGNDFLEPNRQAMRVLAEGLVELGILRCSLDEALDPQKQYYRRYTVHNVSHMLGLDVHDCAKARSENYRQGTLQPRMALTVEPGLYFQPDDGTVPEQFRGIGVRIEDDVIVTGDGHDNLSAILPSQANAVERWMAAVQRG